jgi:hypothetical protein
MDRHRVFPLTMEEVLDDSSFDPPDHYADNGEYEEKSYPLLLAPPSTPTNGLDCLDCHERECHSQDKFRWGSFSSDGSSPSMVDDYSGISDSDAEPAIDDLSPETTTFLWNQYEKLWGGSQEEVSIVYRRPCIPKAFVSPPSILPEHPSAPQEYCYQPTLKSKPTTFPGEGKLTPISTSIMDDPPPSLHRSHAQRNTRRTPNIFKSLPPPPKRGGSHLQRSTSKKARSQSDWNPLPPHREHPFYIDSPYRIRPSTNPCNSSQPFSFHNTPPLPYLRQAEKSVFECDSDDERHDNSATRSSSTFASKLHFRSVSLGSKRLGFAGNKDAGKEGHDSRGRRRSATDIVRGMFGIRKS